MLLPFWNTIHIESLIHCTVVSFNNGWMFHNMGLILAGRLNEPKVSLSRWSTSDLNEAEKEFSTDIYCGAIHIGHRCL